MALDLAELSDLGSFLSNYQEQFKAAQVRKTPVDLAAGNYTGKIEKVYFDKLPDGSKFMLKWEISVLSAKEPKNQDQIGNLTQKTEWINPSDSANVPDQLARIKQSLYNAGLVVDDIAVVANPDGKLLGSLAGCVVKFVVQINENKNNPDKPYINLYINGVISRPLHEIESKAVEDSGDPF